MWRPHNSTIKQTRYENTKGFTLVELSIVIVVIGLIVVAVTAGQSLVKSGRLQAQIQQLTGLNTGFNAFVLAYNAIPGDMKNASSYWSGVTDGNGNGSYESCADDSGANSTTREFYTIFQHLSSAKLISGTYNNTYVLGVGYPALKINPNKGMMAGRCIDSGGVAGFNYQLSLTKQNMTYKAALYLNIANPTDTSSGFDDYNGVMGPVQAYAIDKKIDDGLAGSGYIKGYSGWNAWTTPSAACLTGHDGEYDISLNNTSCMLEYILK